MTNSLSLRGRWRRLALGLPTVLGLKPRGWFIPHRYTALLPAAGAQPLYPAIDALFERHRAAFTTMIDLVDRHAETLLAHRNLLEQAWFPTLDAAVAHALVRERKPRHIVEVGSGHSTRLLSRALAGCSEILAIDPAPRADIAGLPGVRVLASTLQAAPLDSFDMLGAGDLLFIDSSHILMPGSDVDLLLNRVLPRLPAGVLIHIHDVFLPFDYPAMWGWRNYNEQQGVAPLLTTGAYVPLFSSVWAERRLADRLARSVVPTLPHPADALATSLWLEKTLMLAALQRWLFDSGEPRELPERVQAAIRRQQERSEILIAWVQLAIIGLVATVNESASMPSGDVQFGNVEQVALGGYGILCVVRLVLAYRRLLRPWMLYVSVVADIALLMALIFSLHLKYAQPAAFYLKVPTLLYVFLFIALRALRFEVRFVVFTGLVAVAGWILLILYVISGYGGPPDPVTDDFVEYMTSNVLLIHAEADKIIAILLTTAVLAVAIARARHLLERAVSEGAAVRDLSRFFDPGVAARIRTAAIAVKAGEGELREATILTVDLRGFTRLSTELAPDDVMKLLQDYQGRICPLIVGNGGSIDKFLGDGILASFGAVAGSSTSAADALRAADAVLETADRWNAERRAAGLAPLSIGLAVGSGRVVFGAVGDSERLEYTVIGDAVNFTSKLEKHNKEENTRALTDVGTYALAERQGYISQNIRERRPARPVAGVVESVDIVVLAA